MRKLKVGIIGATGMVGQRFISILSSHPWFDVSVLAASSRSEGKTYKDAVSGRWNMETDIPENISSKKVLNIFDYEKICSQVDFVFCAVNLNEDDVRNLEYEYAKHECPVVSNNSAHRWTDDVPIIIPEINHEHIKIIEKQKKRIGTKRGFIVAKPNCSLQCFLPTIYPLKDIIESVYVSTYQAISGAGKTFNQFPEIIDNVIPYISGEEFKTDNEPLKILGTINGERIVNYNRIKIFSNCIRVPVSNGHLASVFVKFSKDISCDEIVNKWNEFNSLNLPSSPKQFIKYFFYFFRPQTKLDRDRDNGMGISVGRLSKCDDNHVKFVCLSHNTIRGAAGGAILCAELLHFHGYFD